MTREPGVPAYALVTTKPSAWHYAGAHFSRDALLYVRGGAEVGGDARIVSPIARTGEHHRWCLTQR